MKVYFVLGGAGWKIGTWRPREIFPFHVCHWWKHCMASCFKYIYWY